MDRTPPGLVGRFLEQWQCAGLLGTRVQVAGAPGGPTSGLLDDDIALKGPTSPFRGLTPHFSAHFGILACKSDK
jgi:hypothetical protein